MKHPSTFSFDPNIDENTIQCVDGLKFNNWFLRYFRGGLGILVTFSNAGEQNFVAWSVVCASDDVTNRPIFGQMNINPKIIQQDFRTLIDTFLHQTFHIMGFSPDLFEYFVDNNLLPVDINSLVVFDQQKKITGIKSPSVLRAAQEHFGCSYIKSVNVENEGAKGYSGSHWERNILMNEIMTVTNISSSRASLFTQALLQDSGWYEVNQSFAEHFTHWKNVGCKLNFDLDVKSILVN